MQDLIEALERLQMCESLSKPNRDVLEQCLDEGYEALSADDKSLIRRLLNQQAAGHSGALKRWRERKQHALQSSTSILISDPLSRRSN